MKVLWLASWYPNPYEPYNGDFVQRHAHAVAKFVEVDVIHVLQTGRESKKETLHNRQGNLTEYFYAFDFAPMGFAFLDKIIFNIRYRRFFKQLLDSYIHHKGKPDIVHVHVPVKAGLMALYLKKKYGLSYIVSEQSSHYEPTSPFYFFKRSQHFQQISRKIFAGAAAVTNVSATIGNKLKQIFNLKECITIHNLVNTHLFNYQQSSRRSKIRLLHVSALGEQKNPYGLIRALSFLLKQNSSWECTICGPANSDLVNFVTRSNLNEYVKFTGEIPYGSVADYMKNADVFVLFSNHENFPCVIVEALCCGLPVVASVAGGIAEAVNETNGLLVPAGDENALAAALHKMITTYHQYDRNAIATNAGKLYNQTIIAQQFVALYHQIIN